MSEQKREGCSSERRRAARMRQSLKVLLTRLELSSEPECPAYLEELSSEGLYVSNAQPLPVGAVVRVRLGYCLCAVGQVCRVDSLNGKSAIAIRLPRRAPVRARFSDRVSGTLLGTPWELFIPGLRESAFVEDYRLRRVKILVERHYNRRWSLERVADLAGLQPNYFSAFFHRKTGVSFREWLQSVRAARAMLLLANQNFTISEVADKIGCGNLRSFERLFQQCTNISPRLFRQLQRP